MCAIDGDVVDIDTNVLLFISGEKDAADYHDVILFSSPETPGGRVVHVSVACANGRCKCVYSLGGVKSQLLPCHFAYLLFGGFIETLLFVLIFSMVLATVSR